MLARVRRICARKSPMCTLLPCSSIDAVPEISRIVSPFRSIRMPARKRTWLGVGVGFVQHAVIGDRALLDWRVRDGFQNFCKCVHGVSSFFR